MELQIIYPTIPTAHYSHPTAYCLVCREDLPHEVENVPHAYYPLYLRTMWKDAKIQ